MLEMAFGAALGSLWTWIMIKTCKATGAETYVWRPCAWEEIERVLE